MIRGAAAMQQVTDWLEKLGLGQYAQRFAENDISLSVLPDLTDQDLKEIGVSLGHRRQLLRAIAELPSHEKRAAKATGATVPTAFLPPSRSKRSPLGECHDRRFSKFEFHFSKLTERRKPQSQARQEDVMKLVGSATAASREEESKLYYL
jgi:hypothetical protein